jgi:hypothetical protein
MAAVWIIHRCSAASDVQRATVRGFTLHALPFLAVLRAGVAAADLMKSVAMAASLPTRSAA